MLDAPNLEPVAPAVRQAVRLSTPTKPLPASRLSGLPDPIRETPTIT
jgi:hypothetical protein